MKTKTILCLLAVTLLLLWTGKASSSLALDEEEITIPPEAHQKAIQSLKALGPERGALELTYRVLTIEGIAMGLTARSEKIQAALKELEAEETKTDYRIELPGDILFDLDEWTIRKDAEETLSKVGEVISAYQHPVSIIGHTDSLGSESYNMELSKKRAESVKQWLIDQAGIDSKRIETSGKGESEPVAPNTNPDGSDNPEGRQKNRRVEIRIRKN